jgi:hypothetical protein
MTLDRETFSVTVERNGEKVVTIETGCLSGRDLLPGDDAVIREAAQHLLSFVGPPCVDYGAQSTQMAPR